jgi:hypothetical protein
VLTALLSIGSHWSTDTEDMTFLRARQHDEFAGTTEQ